MAKIRRGHVGALRRTHDKGAPFSKKAAVYNRVKDEASVRGQSAFDVSARNGESSDTLPKNFQRTIL